MTSDRFENTMHDWLTDRAAGSAPARLHADAMTVIGARRQRVGWWATLRAGITGAPTIPGRQAGMALRPLAALVLTLILGVALGFAVASRPAVLPVSTESPQPSPTNSAQSTPQPTPWTLSAPVQTSTFIEPFSYQLPSVDEFRLVMEERDLVGFGYGTGPLTGPDAELATPDYGYFMSNSPRGVAVFEVSPQRAGTSAGFLEQVLGLGETTTPVMPTTFDGRQALTTSFSSCRDTCSDVAHYQGLPSRASKHIATGVASRMIAFQVGNRTIVVDIWAQDDADFDAWLPFATQFVDSIHFVETVSTPAPSTAPTPTLIDKFVRPFALVIPEGVVPGGVPTPWRTGDRLFMLGDTDPLNRGARGIAVAVIDQGFVHECGGAGGRVEVRVPPAQLLNDIETLGGVDFADPTPTTLDGFPALMTSRSERSGACDGGDLHLDRAGIGSPWFSLSDAARSIVADVGGSTVFVDIWARTDAELAEWLPTGMEIVDSIHFVEQ